MWEKGAWDSVARHGEGWHAGGRGEVRWSVFKTEVYRESAVANLDQWKRPARHRRSADSCRCRNLWNRAAWNGIDTDDRTSDRNASFWGHLWHRLKPLTAPCLRATVCSSGVEVMAVDVCPHCVRSVGVWHGVCMSNKGSVCESPTGRALYCCRTNQIMQLCQLLLETRQKVWLSKPVEM